MGSNQAPTKQEEHMTIKTATLRVCLMDPGAQPTWQWDLLYYSKGKLETSKGMGGSPLDCINNALTELGSEVEAFTQLHMSITTN